MEGPKGKDQGGGVRGPKPHDMRLGNKANRGGCGGGRQEDGDHLRYPQGCRSGQESDPSRHCVLKLVPGDRQADLSSNPDSVTYCLCDLRQVT